MTPPSLPPRPSFVLTVVPTWLREMSEDERRALAFAGGGRSPFTEDALLFALTGAVFLLAFVLAALLR